MVESCTNQITMQQILKYYDTLEIPEYALPALINDDWQGLSDEDTKNIKSFLESLEERCGGIVDFGDYDKQPYFSHYPEFGKPCDVIDIRVYAIINTELGEAPINEKDVCSDFDWLTDDFVEEDFLSTKKHRLLFWNHGCTCMLRYTMYTNFFDVVVLSDEGGNLEMAKDDLKQRMAEACDLNEELYLEYNERQEGLFAFRGRYYWIMKRVNG